MVFVEVTVERGMEVLVIVCTVVEVLLLLLSLREIVVLAENNDAGAVTVLLLVPPAAPVEVALAFFLDLINTIRYKRKERAQGSGKRDKVDVEPDIHRELRRVPSILITDLECVVALSQV